MMAAVQPFISGAISKTVNMPEDATVEDIEQIHIDSWKLGLKAVAIYRDNCKVAQPLAMAKKAGTEEKADPTAHTALTPAAVEAAVESAATAVVSQAPVSVDELDKYIVKGAVRRELPKIRSSKTFSFKVADSKGYATVGEYEDGSAGELFIHFAKHGSTLRGMMDAISVSQGLQYGVPLKTYVKAFMSTSFAPSGITDDPEIRTASSLIDYIFRRLAINYLSFDDRLELGLASFEDMPDEQISFLDAAQTTTEALAAVDEQAVAPEAEVEKPTPVVPVVEEVPHRDSVVTKPTRQQGATVTKDDTAPMCYNCGNQTQRSGSCYVCTSCGSTTGCS
jgi:ribonucleoside-diphosphate reductase alpha chain